MAKKKEEEKKPEGVKLTLVKGCSFTDGSKKYGLGTHEVPAKAVDRLLASGSWRKP